MSKEPQSVPMMAASKQDGQSSKSEETRTILNPSAGEETQHHERCVDHNASESGDQVAAIFPHTDCGVDQAALTLSESQQESIKPTPHQIAHHGEKQSDAFDNEIHSDNAVSVIIPVVTAKEERSGEREAGWSNNTIEGEGEEKSVEDRVQDPLCVDLYDKLKAESESDPPRSKPRRKLSASAKARKKKPCSREKQLHALLMTVFVVMSFAMVFGLFVLQSQISMNSLQLVTRVQRARRAEAVGVQGSYLEYLGEGPAPSRAVLRVNTTIFIH